MLVLSRKVQESIRIGDDIEITVVQVSGNRVRLAISAPATCKVMRTELISADSASQAGVLADEPDDSSASARPAAPRAAFVRPRGQREPGQGCFTKPRSSRMSWAPGDEAQVSRPCRKVDSERRPASSVAE